MQRTIKQLHGFVSINIKKGVNDNCNVEQIDVTTLMLCDQVGGWWIQVKDFKE